MIEDFLRRLASAGLNADLREARDGLWLAQHLATTPDLPSGRSEGPERHGGMRPTVGGPTRPVPQPGPGDDGQSSGAALHAAGPGGGGRTLQGVQTRSPAVPALRHQLRLIRALRPLKRQVASRSSYQFDEAATAEQAAGQAYWLPVFRPAPVRWLELELVVDQSPSMVVWRRTAAELKTALERLAAFRTVRESFVDSAAEGRILVRDRSGRSRKMQAPGPAEQARAVLVVTDAVGAAWRDGRMDDLLRSLGNAAPTAVVTVLPQRMWPGSGLRAEPGRLRAVAATAPGVAGVGRTWTAAAHPPAPVPVSVMELAPRWLRPWAEVLSGAQGWRKAALLVPRADTPVPGTGGIRNASLTASSAVELVQRFRAGASPVAFQLACYLSATGLNLPVMRLVQQVMLPRSEAIHLAEVFLSGLLQAEPVSGDIDGEIAQYDFLPGVRDELNNYLVRDEMLDVVRETSQFISERFGQPLDFAALLADPEGAPMPVLEGTGSSALAYVNISVLAKLGGRYQILADRLAAAASAERQPAVVPAELSVSDADPITFRRNSNRRSGPYFFLSYARTPRRDPTDKTDPDRWVYKLYKDLCEEILQMTDAQGFEVGFMDRDNKLGAEWSPDLMSALQACRVFVPLYSRRYFESDNCGREWFAFAQRQITHVAAGEPAIVPALWHRLDWEQIPPVAQSFQYDHADMGVRYVAEGFYGIMKLRNYRGDYQRAVHRLAARIIETADRPPAHQVSDTLEQAPDRRDFESLPSAFGPASARRTTDGNFQICVLAPVVSALPPGRSLDCYGETPLEWHPYQPRYSQPLASYAFELARKCLDVIPQAEAIDELLQRASSMSPQRPTLVIIDPWIALIPQYREQLKALNQVTEPWVNIMFPWNSEDEGLAAANTAIREELRRLLPRKLDAVPRRCRMAADGIPTLRDFSELFPEMTMTTLRRYRKSAPARPPEGPPLRRPRLRQAGPGDFV